MSLDDYHDDPALERVEQLLRASGAPPEPSDALRARLMAIPKQEPRAAAMPDGRRGVTRIWSSIAAWRLASASLAVAAVVLAVIAVTGGSSSTSVQGQVIAMTASSEYDATGSAVSLVSNGVRHIRVRIDGLPPLEGSQVFELWIAKDRKHRIAIGVFRPTNGRIDTTVSIPDLGPHWRGIWLTHEQGKGTPGWSRDWVVAARLA